MEREECPNITLQLHLEKGGGVAVNPLEFAVLQLKRRPSDDMKRKQWCQITNDSSSNDDVSKAKGSLIVLVGR